MKKLLILVSVLLLVNSLPKIIGKPSVSPTSEYQPGCHPCQICTDWDSVCWSLCDTYYTCSECTGCIKGIATGGYNIAFGLYDIYRGNVLIGTVKVVWGEYNIYLAVLIDCPQCIDCAQEGGECLKNCCNHWGSGVICPLT